MDFLVDQVVDVRVEFDDVVPIELLTSVDQLQLRVRCLEFELNQGRRTVRQEVEFFEGFLKVRNFTEDLTDVAAILKTDLCIQCMHGFESVQMNDCSCHHFLSAASCLLRDFNL